ncbi:phenylalanine--tRNA ligase subunit beta [Fructobacillus parabroussonetiae]|uniref:Phenylalanine--tRNA ligase beta subunit n=1 Tax=Fructobacillus parabroussonetiae TaxID=2713174 RepID=A0ABS5QY17_9LACO|nr:phenylalanine--tRNA ligase subunit beta [Fructobacillus parabroussonetiae]MBS9337867.1 phenylalanine--tRNA ligase subunit beta [Fructobacillus parabroussonetiae]
MKTNLKWLNDYLTPGLDLSEQAILDLAQQIELTAVEIEEVGQAAAKQDGLVVVRVDEVKDHPDSDHLHITQVFDGQEQIQVVTGAPNVAEGQLVILASVGSHIIDRESGEMVKIRKAKLRGEVSYGMLSALQEIGLPDAVCPEPIENGIYVFDEKAGVNPGDDALEVLGLKDPMVDTDLTPNRADLLSMRGMAYELAAMTNQQVQEQQVSEAPVSATQAVDQVTVTSASQSLATGVALSVINDLTVEKSPLALQRRLWTSGIKPTNNVLDAMQEQLLATGQPLAAFDLATLPDSNLTVRLAEEGEVLGQGDGEETIALRAGQDIVLASGSQVLALAGIQQDPNFAVSEKTRDVLLVAGQYNPSLIRQAARRHGLRSASSFRLERGIDRSNTQTALASAANCIALLANGKVAAGQALVGFNQEEQVTITMPLGRFNQVLGTSLTEDEILMLLRKLALDVSVDQGKLTAVIPGRRTDLRIPADLVEEVGRLYGYDNLPTALIDGQSTAGDLTGRQKKIRASRQIMQALGFDQAISYALMTPEKATAFNIGADHPVLALNYPMSSDRTTARQNLLSGLIDDVAYNVARSVKNMALYEQGRVFLNDNAATQPVEQEHLAAVLVGSIAESTWQPVVKEREVDFYAMKGRVESYLENIGIENVTFKAAKEHQNMHPGQTADIYAGSVYLGYVGQVHPEFLAKQKLPAIFAFELNLEEMIDVAKRDNAYQPISRYPQITRDLAILVDADLANQEVVDLIWQTAGQHLKTVSFFDLYTGQGTPENKKSLAYQLTYQDQNDTLVEEKVTKDFAKVQTALVEKFGAEIR